MEKPLQGVRILDLSVYLAGPFGSMILADLGADVIKIEVPGRGDHVRTMPPHFVRGTSAYFIALNRNKRSVTLNLKDEEGYRIFLGLVEHADIVYDNYRPGVLERLKADYETLREVNPRIICASLSGYGHTGPDRDKRALDLIIQGRGGVMSFTGEPGGPPLRMGVPMGTGHASAVPIGAYECGGGQWLTLDAPLQHFWEGLCDALGRPEWKRDPRMIDQPARLENRDYVDENLRAVFRTDTARHWIEKLEAHGVPSGPIQTIDQVLADPQVLAREMVTEMEHPELGPIRTYNTPIKMEGTWGAKPSPPPLAGEHTEEVLREMLGIPEEKCAELRARGVI